MRPKLFLSKPSLISVINTNQRAIKEQSNLIFDPQRVSEGNTLHVVDVKTHDATKLYQEDLSHIQRFLTLSSLVKIKAY